MKSNPRRCSLQWWRERGDPLLVLECRHDVAVGRQSFEPAHTHRLILYPHVIRQIAILLLVLYLSELTRVVISLLMILLLCSCSSRFCSTID